MKLFSRVFWVVGILLFFAAIGLYALSVPAEILIPKFLIAIGVIEVGNALALWHSSSEHDNNKKNKGQVSR